MKTYQISYDPEQNKGVYALSVVKSPAMESKFITLKEQQEKPLKLATISEERRVLMGIALIPDKPIYRNDPEMGEYNIVFSKDTIEKAAYDFIRNGNSNNSTIEHELDLGSDAVSVVESWIIEDAEADKSRKYGFDEPVGSWAVVMKVHDDAIWAMAKAGEIEGFSIDGFFNLKEIKMSETKAPTRWEQFMQLFADDKPEPAEPKAEVKLGEVKSADGSVTMEFEGETLEAGVNIAIKGEDGNVDVEPGTYELEDNKVLVVSEVGIVESVTDKPAEEQEEAEMSDAEFDKLLDAIMGLKADSKAQAVELAEVKTQLATIQAKPASEGIKPKATKLATTEKKGKLTLAERLENLNK
jgi:hypothetical protein